MPTLTPAQIQQAHQGANVCPDGTYFAGESCVVASQVLQNLGETVRGDIEVIDSPRTAVGIDTKIQSTINTITALDLQQKAVQDQINNESTNTPSQAEQENAAAAALNVGDLPADPLEAAQEINRRAATLVEEEARKGNAVIAKKEAEAAAHQESAQEIDRWEKLYLRKLQDVASAAEDRFRGLGEKFGKMTNGEFVAVAEKLKSHEKYLAGLAEKTVETLVKRVEKSEAAEIEFNQAATNAQSKSSNLGSLGDSESGAEGNSIEKVEDKFVNALEEKLAAIRAKKETELDDLQELVAQSMDPLLTDRANKFIDKMVAKIGGASRLSGDVFSDSDLLAKNEIEDKDTNSNLVGTQSKPKSRFGDFGDLSGSNDSYNGLKIVREEIGEPIRDNDMGSADSGVEAKLDDSDRDPADDSNKNEGESSVDYYFELFVLFMLLTGGVGIYFWRKKEPE